MYRKAADKVRAVKAPIIEKVCDALLFFVAFLFFLPSSSLVLLVRLSGSRDLHSDNCLRVFRIKPT